MTVSKFKRMPKHIGVIPDGNRRWAKDAGMQKGEGYQYGVDAGFKLYKKCMQLEIPEITFYGFTQDNTRRPKHQRNSFQKACVDAVQQMAAHDAQLRVIGKHESPMFPEELKQYVNRKTFGAGSIKVNFLVNYDWAWDLSHLSNNLAESGPRNFVPDNLASHDVSRIDLVIRWGGRRRLSGFLPVQSVYADMYVHDTLWPDFKSQELIEALKWYQKQDVTLGG